jgi:hypothetical protein
MNSYFDDINKYYVLKQPSEEGMKSNHPRLPRNGSSLSNIIGILDALSTDMRVALNVTTSVSRDPIPTLLRTGGLLACPGGRETTCKKEEMRMTILGSLTFYPNGTKITAYGPGPFLAPIQTSIINIFVALQDAYQYVHTPAYT